MSDRTNATAAATASGTSPEPIVDARGVVKSYRAGATEVQALGGTDLVMQRGEIVAVVGPSGSGKTTLLNCLSGLDEIDAGQVHIAGEDLHAMSDRHAHSLPRPLDGVHLPILPPHPGVHGVGERVEVRRS
ncbi:MAG: ATP-binding cassette domain-containing protein [Actinomycetota bacterium]|nr:ATP-binding cassette domain-containing protein [Actinomycetota bacterium]